ncbi:MAG TPA: hypothetical protein VLL08_27675, partial [Kineosporiaceae bacterium]|nr:hypothetical protein [Kineosporiaceae bacterium]
MGWGYFRPIRPVHSLTGKTDVRAVGTDFSTVAPEDLQAATDRLNGRPRNVLDFATPSEVLADLLGIGGATT